MGSLAKLSRRCKAAKKERPKKKHVCKIASSGGDTFVKRFDCQPGCTCSAVGYMTVMSFDGDDSELGRDGGRR